MSETFPTDAVNMSKNDPKHSPSMSKIILNMSRQCPTSIQHVSKVYPKTLTNIPNHSTSFKIDLKSHTCGISGGVTGQAPGIDLGLPAPETGWTTGLSGLRCSLYVLYTMNFNRISWNESSEFH